MKISLKSCVLALMLIVLTLTAAAALADGSVSGTVWFDRNADGIMDSSEKGLNGAALTLYSAGETSVAGEQSGIAATFIVETAMVSTFQVQASLSVASMNQSFSVSILKIA